MPSRKIITKIKRVGELLSLFGSMLLLMVVEERSEAVAFLAQQIPEVCLRFAENLYADPDMNPARAAAAIGRAGQHRELLADRRVQLALATIGGEMRESFKDLRRQAVVMLSRMLAFDPREAFAQNGQMLPPAAWPDTVAMCVESYKQKADGTVEVRFCKKLDVLELFFRVMGDLDSTDVTGRGAVARVHFHGRDEQG